MNYRPVFLIYLNRSGSTYLAQQLDKFEGIEVSPEAHLKDNIYRAGYAIKNKKDLKKYLDRFYKYDKNKSWGIDRDLLINKLKEHTFPIPFNSFLKTIWDLYIKSTPEVFIYKSPYIFFIEKIKKSFPDAIFILIIRDLRGIYRSQKNTKVSKWQIRMAYTPIEIAYKFNKTLKVIQKYQHENYFYWIKYEDFIWRNDKKEVLKLLIQSQSAVFVTIYHKITPHTQYLKPSTQYP